MIDFSKFNYPSQWDEASDFWSQMLRTGMPTDIEPWWQAQQEKTKYGIERAGKEAAEQFGLGGMRYSTPLGQQLGRLGSEAWAGIAPQYWGMGAGMKEAAKGRQMGAAQGLMGVGSEFARFPLETGERMLGMSGEYQRQRMASMFPFMQEFQRMTPERSPWLQYGAQFPYGAFQQEPVQYQQSPFSQMLGFGAQLLPTLLSGGSIPPGMLQPFYPSEWGELR